MCTQPAAAANAQGASATTFIIEHRIPQPDTITIPATGAEDGQVAARIEDSVNVVSGTPLSLEKRLSLAHHSHLSHVRPPLRAPRIGSYALVIACRRALTRACHRPSPNSIL